MNARQQCLRRGAEGGSVAGGQRGQRLRSIMTCVERKDFENAEIKRNETKGISRNARDDWGLHEELWDLGKDGIIILKFILDTWGVSV
jgi:hypothetical protein